jgi:RNA polymerase sigma factor (sigma-70 family)
MNLLHWIQKEVTALSADEEHRLLRAAQCGCRSARRILLESYLPLVARLARNQWRRGMDLGDLLDAGVVALAVAVRKIDPNRGTRLSSYAYQTITRAICEEADFARRMIRPPRPGGSNRCRTEAGSDFQRLADHGKVLRPVLSLDEGDEPLGAILPDHRDAWAEIERRDEARWLRRQLLTLPDRERIALETEYFLGGRLDDVGPRFGCGRKAGSKWHIRGLKRLRRLLGQGMDKERG